MPKPLTDRTLIEEKLSHGRKLTRTELALFMLQSKKKRQERADVRKQG